MHNQKPTLRARGGGGDDASSGASRAAAFSKQPHDRTHNTTQRTHRHNHQHLQCTAPLQLVIAQRLLPARHSWRQLAPCVSVML